MLFKFRNFIVATSLLLTFGSCKSEQKERKIIPTAIKFKKEGELSLYKSDSTKIRTIDIEIADNDYERETGLMHRASMETHQGMLFIFPDMAQRGFYMKNTLISLDIIYIDDKGRIVSFVEQAKPLKETTLPSQVPAQYVLELNGGLAEEWVLEVGDYVVWDRD
ncbi:DUF192 domain-containing protein [Dokdonia sinensis]|uniref:DUF192 domain-containing protein n=1 Tax=Dokdonia sinensis TaxID=2479847 RepID=A0A3M0G759_9FLAO|nr:DUF192 domain-containing protein [Dokdonia sinensis]RMB56889.1 DUF192 domain-containing protein [Dokdonia sinensis]